LDRNSGSTQCSSESCDDSGEGQFFIDLKCEYGEESTVASFMASEGWFQHFKKCCNLHNIKITGETASAESEKAMQFVSCIRNLIEGGNYSEQQMFNVDEIGLCWKQVPLQTKSQRRKNGFWF
jgi:hypothetical protein